MTTKTKTTTAQKAYGKKLDKPVSYTYTWREYDTEAELIAAKDEMTLEEQRKTRNVEQKTNARAKSLTAALDAAGIVKPTIDNDDQLRLQGMFKMLMSSKRYTEEAARELASSTLGVAWADEDEE